MKSFRLLTSVAILTVLALPSLSRAADTPLSGDGIRSVEERRILTSLAEQQKRLAGEEEKLRLQEMELKILQTEIDKKLDMMKKLRDELDQLLQAKDEEEIKRVQELSKMYERMDPASAAELLAGLDRELAVGILSGIKAKVAGKLLNNMDPSIAARFTQAYSTLARD